MNDISRIFGNRIITAGRPIHTAGEQKVHSKSDSPIPFDDILRKQVSSFRELKFSKHAENRLKSRNITIDTEQRQKINDAILKAEKKGVKESLILMENLALVVSVENRTVITAVSSDELKDNVFTNIDGAVII
ncbi:MAG: flagellar biosynthesis protein [Clostridiaceae bacterium]|nr:flagellar biosynthesis protein [Clostridiaceae bacterium]